MGKELSRPSNFAYPTPPEIKDVSQLEIAGAAFRQENDVVNAIQLLQKEKRPAADADFDFLTSATQSKYWASHPSKLARAQSQQELQMIEAQIEKEEADRQLLASQGMAGFAWGLAAGVVSPTMMIPLIGQARGAKGIGQAFALAATAAVAQEAPLFANQLTRTPTESMVGVAGGTVLGGLLGSAAVMLRQSDFDRIAREMGPTPATARPVLTTNNGKIVSLDVPPIQLPENIPATPAAFRRQDADRIAKPPAPKTPEAIKTELKELKAEVKSRSNIQPVARELAESSSVSFGTRRGLEADGRGLFTDLNLEDLEFPELREWETMPGPKEFKKLVMINGQQVPVVGVVKGSRDAFGRPGFEGVAFPVGPDGVEAAMFKARKAMPGAETAAEVKAAKITDEGSVGAKAREDQFMPMRTVINEDGSVAYEPFIDNDGVVDPGKMAPATMVGRLASVTSPILRAINQFDQPVVAPETRRIFQSLSDSGVSMEGNRAGISTTAEGTVEHRLGYYQGLLGNFYRAQHEAYLKYAFEGEPNAMQRAASVVMMETGRAPKGKLSFAEFKERVADAANLGDKSDIPEVQEAANFLRNEFFAKIHDAADEAAEFTGGRRLYEFFDPKNEDESYMRHQFAPEKVAERRMDFIEDVAKHYEDVLNATFGRRVQKALAKAEAEASYEDILRMTQDEAQKLYDELGEQLVRMKDPQAIQDQLDVVRSIRAEARQLYDEAFLRLEKKNVNEDPAVTRDNKRMAREEVQEERQKLLDKAEALENSLPKAVFDDKKKRAQLREMRRMLNESMGRLETRQAETYARIEKNDEANIKNFERVVRGTQKYMKAMGKVTDEVLDQQLAGVKKQLDLAVKRLESNKLRQEKMAAKDPNAPELKELEEKYLSLQEALYKRAAQFEKLQDLDRNAQRELIRGTLDDVIAYVNGVNSKRSERNAMLRAKAKELDPAQVEGKIKAMQTRQLLRFENLEEQLQGAGAIDINARAGRFDFSEIAREIATDLQNKIAGNVSRIAQIDAMASLRSPMKRRVLNLPYDVKRKYLELDTEKVVTRYARTMGSDIELYRATGSVDGSNAARAINEEYMKLKDYLATREFDETGKRISEKNRTKQLVQMDKAHKARLEEFDATIERLRGIRGIPKDPSGMSYRLGRMFLNMNTASMMGSAAITSIPDAARAVMAHGMMRTFGKAWMPFISGLVDESQKEVNQQMVRQLRLFGIGNDVYTGTRARGTFDIAGADFGSQTAVERFFDFAAAKTPQIALFGPWTDYMKQVTGTATMSRFFTAIEDLNAGRINDVDLEYLTQASISPDMARRIQDQMNRTATRYKDTLIPNVEQWDDYGAMRAFHAAMSREDARLVITPGLERPLWMDANMLGRVIGQFRSFTMASNTKILVSGLQQRNMAAAYALQGTAFSLALGAVSYYIWAMTSGERARKEMQEAGWETWLDQAIYRSGLLGAFSEVQSIGSEIPATRPYVTFAGDDLAGRRANSVLGAIAGPTFGKSEDIASLLVGIDDPTEATVSQARKLLPWQNVFYLREALTQVEEGTANLLNLPERRQ